MPDEAEGTVRAGQTLEALIHDLERLIRLEQRPRGREMPLSMVDLLKENRGAIRQGVLDQVAGRARELRDQVAGRCHSVLANFAPAPSSAPGG